MIRLTRTMRDSICNDAVEHKMKTVFDELKARENKMAEECYHKLFKKDIDNILKIKEDSWFNQSPRMSFNLGFRSVTLKFNIPKRIPHGMYSYNYGNKPTFLVSDIGLEAEYEAWQSDQDAAASARKELVAKITALLNSVSTMKRLQEIWPEGALFYNKYIRNDDAPGLPAIAITEINRLLGIDFATAA